MEFTGKSILHIITGLDNGGAQAALYRLCTSDLNNRHSVISLLDEDKYGPLLKDADIKVYCLHMPRGGVSLSGLITLWQLIRQIKPDVVQTWMYHADLLGGIIARLAGMRSICWGVRHSDVHPVKTKRSTRLVVWCCAQVSRWLPIKIVCCAHKALQVHRQLGYPAEKFDVIPNGYDLNKFRPDQEARARLRSELGIADSLPLLGMVARFDPQKDHLNLVKALSILKQAGVDFRCLLVGPSLTAHNQELLRYIAEYDIGDKLILLGPRNDIPVVMNALDVHILSSAYGEAFPNVLAEAMACGTPCITTDVGDAALIASNLGWVVPGQDAEALAAGIKQSLAALNNRAEWQDRQQRCRKRMQESFSIEKMVAAYRQVWLEATVG